MNTEPPIQDPIYVLKNGHRLGPLSVDEILDFIEEGSLDYNDLCLREGAAECERIREILDWDTDDEIGPEESEEGFAIEPVSENKIKRAKPQQEIVPREPSSTEEEETAAHHEKEQVPPGSLKPSTILYRGHPSIATYPGALLGISVGVGLGIWLHDINIWLTVGGFALALICFTYLTFCRAVCLYLITPKRVEIVTGLIAKNSNEARISDVRAINVSRSGFIGMLGVGTVEFSTTGDESEVTFTNVWSAHEVKALVRDIQDSASG